MSTEHSVSAAGGPDVRRAPLRRRRLLASLVGFSLVAGAILGVTDSAGQVSAAQVVYSGAGANTWSIGVIGDSAWAGIRWENAFAPLQRFNFRADLESCRRTAVASCRGREGYAPPSTLAALQSSAGRWGAVLVVATGYNDAGTIFGSSVDAVMAEAMRQQIYRVVWMTMRTADVVTYVSPGFTSNVNTFRDNNKILVQKAAQYGGRLIVADWATYSLSHPDWFVSDGVHLSHNGAFAAADFIAVSAQQALSGVTPMPPAVTTPTSWVDVRPGDRGERVVIVQQFLARAGIAIFGGADGIYGSYTADAVKEFQNRVGLPASGAVDKATAVELGLWYRDPSSPPRTPVVPQWVDVGPGDSGMRVAIVQQYLRRAGIGLTGDADGVYRAATADAVRSFQARMALPATGVVDEATAIKLGLWKANTAPPSAPTNDWVNVGPGDTGMRVAIVQLYLRRAGVAVDGDSDGRYGSVTTAAVRSFQSAHALPATGVVDKATAIALGLWYRSTTTASAPTAASATAATPTTTVPGTTIAPAIAAISAVASAEPPPGTEAVTEEPVGTSAETVVATEASAMLGDLVWLDADQDGRQGTGEAGFEGVTVRLLRPDRTRLAETTTDRDGSYEFVGLSAGSYLVEFVVPHGFDVTLLTAGNDTSRDSDADPASRLATELEVTVYAKADIDGTTTLLDIDAGFVTAPEEVAAPTTEADNVVESTSTTEEITGETAPPTDPSAVTSTSAAPPATDVSATAAAATTAPATTAPATTTAPTSTAAPTTSAAAPTSVTSVGPVEQPPGEPAG